MPDTPPGTVLVCCQSWSVVGGWQPGETMALGIDHYVARWLTTLEGTALVEERDGVPMYRWSLLSPTDPSPAMAHDAMLVEALADAATPAISDEDFLTWYDEISRIE